MLTLSWRKVGRSAPLTLALVVGLPALAQAQLFPNMWITRQRPDCSQEPPFYGHVRRDYFGYYPTCWRKFPEGWGCPAANDERPDIAKAFDTAAGGRARDAKPVLPPEDLELNPGGRAPGGRPQPGVGGDRSDPGFGGGRSGTDPSLPPIPGTPGAFPPPGGNRNPGPADPFLPTSPLAPGAQPGRTQPPAGGSQPFDPISPGIPRSSNDSGPLPRVSNLPSLEGPAADQPRGATAGGNATLLDEVGADPNAPVLALPSMSPPNPRIVAGDSLVVASMPPSLPPSGTYVDPVDPAPAPAQAPRRPSRIGGLFNWLRR